MAAARLLTLLALVPACYESHGNDVDEDPETQGGSFELTLELDPNTDFQGSNLADVSVPGEVTFAADHAGAPDDGPGFRLSRANGTYHMVTGDGDADLSAEHLSFVVDIPGYHGAGDYDGVTASVDWRSDQMGDEQLIFDLDRDTCVAVLDEDTLSGSITCEGILHATWTGLGIHFQ